MNKIKPIEKNLYNEQVEQGLLDVVLYQLMPSIRVICNKKLEEDKDNHILSTTIRLIDDIASDGDETGYTLKYVINNYKEYLR